MLLTPSRDLFFGKALGLQLQCKILICAPSTYVCNNSSPSKRSLRGQGGVGRVLDSWAWNNGSANGSVCIKTNEFKVSAPPKLLIFRLNFGKNLLFLFGALLDLICSYLFEILCQNDGFWDPLWNPAGPKMAPKIEL